MSFDTFRKSRSYQANFDSNSESLSALPSSAGFSLTLAFSSTLLSPECRERLPNHPPSLIIHKYDCYRTIYCPIPGLGLRYQSEDRHFTFVTLSKSIRTHMFLQSRALQTSSALWNSLAIQLINIKPNGLHEQINVASSLRLHLWRQGFALL